MNFIIQIDEFSKAKQIVDRIYNSFMQLSSLPQEIVKLISQIDSVISLDNSIKEATAHFKELYTLVSFLS